MISVDTLVVLIWIAVGLAVVALLGSLGSRWQAERREREEERFHLRLREIILELNGTDDAKRQRAWERLDALLTIPNTEPILTNLWMLSLPNQTAVVKRVREKGIFAHYMRELSDRNKWNRAKAIKILATVHSEETVRGLIGRLADRDQDIRTFAARALSRYQDPIAEKALIDLLGVHEEAFTHQLAAMFIETGVKSSPQLLEKLSDPNPRARRWAAEILGEVGAPGAAMRFVELLRDPDPDVRAAAVRALGKIRLESAKHAIQPLAQDEAWFVRAHAVTALGEIGGEDTVPTLTSALADRSWWVRKSAIEALVRVGEVADPALRQVLRSEDRFARESAVEILERHGVPEVEIQKSLLREVAS